MAQLGQRAGLDLAHALARDAELAADLLQREGVAVAQPEAELEHQALARRQDVLENVLNLLAHGAGGRGLLGRGAGLVGEHVTKLLLLILADRQLKRDGRARGSLKLVQPLDLHAEGVGQLALGWVAPQLLHEALALAAHAVERRVDVDRQADGAALLGDSAADRLASPPDGVHAEAGAAAPVKAPGAGHKADGALHDEIPERRTTTN